MQLIVIKMKGEVPAGLGCPLSHPVYIADQIILFVVTILVELNRGIINFEAA